MAAVSGAVFALAVSSTALSSSTSSAVGQAAVSEPARTPVPDIEVIDQDGRTRRFYSDLVRDRVVVIAYMFTNCRGVCSPQGKRMQELQEALGDRLGREVSLVSISMDPTTDTPARLAAWSARFKRAEGWTLVTGDPEKLDRLSTALVGAPVAPGPHAPALLIASFDRGVYERTYGLASTEELVERIDDVVATSKRRHALAPSKK